MFSSRRGFGLVDVIVGTALMLLLFVALFGVLKASLSLSALAKAKSAAIELGNTQVEYLRGLAYDSLGTVGGIPSGSVPQSATSTVDGVTYNTRTFIEYTDSPADGSGASDSNSITTDYKTAKVVITYKINGLSKSVSLVSAFVPPGIETTTGGGTLSLHVVNSTGANVSGANVRVVNTSTSPTVDVTTLSNTGGIVLLGGAATSSQYQIYVSNSGYSSAQTYARDSQNVNPNPGYLTVAKNQTTSSTFAIDLLGSLTFATFSPATTTTFFDTFGTSSNVATSSHTVVTAGTLTLSAGQTSGSALAIGFAPSPLLSWGTASASLAMSASTSVAIHIYGGNGTILPDSVLAGNAVGFNAFPVNLSGISTTTYPSLSLGATLSTATTTLPSVLDWTISANKGPAPLPNVTFTTTGGKTTGTTSGGASIYKTIVNSSSGATGSVTIPLEWDSYTVSGLNYDLTDACTEPPYSLPAGGSINASWYLVAPTSNSLFVSVNDNTGTPISGATVQLTKTGFSQSKTTSSCGNAYFGSISSGSYTVTISKTGYTTTVFSNVSISGGTLYAASFP